MKTSYFLIILAVIHSSTHSMAATLLLDDFSGVGFSLSSGGTTSSSGSFVTALTDQRTVSGVGFPNWTVTLLPEELRFNVDQVNPSPGRTYLNLNYSSSSGTFSLLGYNAFAFDITNVVGMGELVAFVDGAPSADVRLAISGSGTYVSPFSGLDTSQSLSSLTQMNFRFFAISEDFALTIDNVRIVPEPSSSLLLLLGGAATSMHRRRRK